MRSSLGTDYTEHLIFSQLKEYSEFYESLSDSVMSFLTQGTLSVYNIDTYVYSSMQGTLESIHDVLIKGRISDSYALLRKYYDSAIINIYTNLYLDDHFSFDNFIVEQINNWIRGKEKIPSFEKMSKYIIESNKLTEITQIHYENGIFKGSLFDKLRQRCNNHTHYLYYQNLLSNDCSIHLPNRIKILNSFSNDIRAVFIMHLSYIFYFKDIYMMSSDYRDYMECGLTPPEDSEYWVAPFIQNIFDKIIKPHQPQIAEIIKTKTAMQIE